MFGKIQYKIIKEFGDPQRSSLAPLLFNIYITSLGKQLRFYNCHKHAHDLKFYISGPSVKLPDLLLLVKGILIP